MTSAQASRDVLRSAVVPTVVVGVLAVVLGGVLKGGLGALGAALGFVITLAFFVGGQVLVDRVLRGAPELAMASALLVYLGQILILFVLIALLQGQEWLDPKVFAATIVACTLAWLGGSVWAWSRQKVMYVEPESTVPADQEYDQ